MPPQVIYDQPKGNWDDGFLGEWLGDELELAPGPRTLTRLIVEYDMAFPGTVDVTARIYKNDGPDGNPQTLLWD
jgi:hypothetical protein